MKIATVAGIGGTVFGLAAFANYAAGGGDLYTCTYLIMSTIYTAVVMCK